MNKAIINYQTKTLKKVADSIGMIIKMEDEEYDESEEE